MAETAVTCEVSCQLYGWNTGATIIAEEDNLFAEILRFLNRCSVQHPSRGAVSNQQGGMLWKNGQRYNTHHSSNSSGEVR